MQRAVRLVEEQDRRGGGVRPVDPREAARGQVEYVKVGVGLWHGLMDGVCSMRGATSRLDERVEVLSSTSSSMAPGCHRRLALGEGLKPCADTMCRHHA